MYNLFTKLLHKNECLYFNEVKKKKNQMNFKKNYNYIHVKMNKKNSLSKIIKDTVYFFIGKRANINRNNFSIKINS